MAEVRKMTFDFGLGANQTCHKRKFRWLFKIPDICATGIYTLPPSKASRPTLTFKEISAEHLNETIYYPGKPDWKPISLTLFDLQREKSHPITDWIKAQYDASDGQNKGKWYRPLENGDFKKTATLELYNGCGYILETWTLENVWPQSINFDDLDMTSSDCVIIDLTLRYDRAFIKSYG